MYLLEDTEEAAGLRQNVYNMLSSSDTHNGLIALQLMEAGGVHGDFLGALCAQVVHEFSYYEKAEEPKPFLAFCRKHKVFAAKDLRWLLKQCRRYYGWYDVSGKIAERAQKDGAFFLASYWRTVLELGYKWSGGENTGICMKYNVTSTKDYLESTIYAEHTGGMVLQLGYYALEDLPDELADIEVDYVYMQSCPFTRLGRKAWQNPHVVYVEYNESLSRNKQHFLLRCFPQYTKWLYKKNHEALTSAALKCIPHAQRDLAFYIRAAECYKREGDIPLALRWYLLLYKQYPDYQEQCFTLKIAGCYALLRNKAQMLHWLQMYIDQTPYDVAKDVYFAAEFDRYRKSRDLQKLLKVAPSSVYLAP